MATVVRMTAGDAARFVGVTPSAMSCWTPVAVMVGPRGCSACRQRCSLAGSAVGTMHRTGSTAGPCESGQRGTDLSYLGLDGGFGGTAERAKMLTAEERQAVTTSDIRRTLFLRFARSSPAEWPGVVRQVAARKLLGIVGRRVPCVGGTAANSSGQTTRSAADEASPCQSVAPVERHGSRFQLHETTSSGARPA